MTELKIESKFYELQLMSTVIKELLELVEIPKTKSYSISHIPASKLVTHTIDVSLIPNETILDSNDKNLLTQAIFQEKKVVNGLKGEVQKLQ